MERAERRWEGSISECGDGRCRAFPGADRQGPGSGVRCWQLCQFLILFLDGPMQFQAAQIFTFSSGGVDPSRTIGATAA